MFLFVLAMCLSHTHTHTHRIRHIEKVASAALKRRDGKATVNWYSRLLALALDTKDFSVDIFCHSKLKTIRKEIKPKLMLQSWRFNTEADVSDTSEEEKKHRKKERKKSQKTKERRVGIQFTMMNDASLQIEAKPSPKFYEAVVEVRNAEKDDEEEMEQFMKKHILVLDKTGRNGSSGTSNTGGGAHKKKMMISEIRKRTRGDPTENKSSSKSFVKSTTTQELDTTQSSTIKNVEKPKHKPLSTFNRVSSYLSFAKKISSSASISSSVGSEDTENRRIVQKKFLEWLLCLASGYFFDLKYILSFNMCQVCLMYMGLPTLHLDIDIINKDEDEKTKQRARQTTGIWNRFTSAITWGRREENMKKFKSILMKKVSNEHFTIASHVYVLQHKILSAQLVHARSSGKNMEGGSIDALDQSERRVEILQAIQMEREN